MSGGRKLGISLGLWVGMLSTLAWAQPAFPPMDGPHLFPPSRTESTSPPAAERFHFAVMGQIARPGVYESDRPEPQLVDLITQAGGLTREATGQIRIVRQGRAGQAVFYSPTLYFPLLSGDIIVADGPSPSPRGPKITPRITAPDFTNPPDTLRQVALVHVLDRPVVLPVPDRHASLPAVLKYLGQDPADAPRVKILPVGPGQATEAFLAPTVLIFDPQIVDKSRLPALPDVRHIGPAATERPGDFRTAERSRALTLPAMPTPLERFQHSEIEETQTVFSDPPLIAKLREVERQIPQTTEQIAEVSVPSVKSSSDTESPSPPMTGLEQPAEPLPEAEADSGFGWTTAGIFLLLAAGGFYAWRKWQSWPEWVPDFSMMESFPPISFFERESEERLEAPAERKTISLPGVGDVMSDEVLAELMFNRLPVVEEPLEVPAKKPKEARPQFRIDPPQEARKKPYIAEPIQERSRPANSPTAPPRVADSSVTEPEPKEPADTEPKPVESEAPNRQGLLDRVLQQVHQKRAA